MEGVASLSKMFIMIFYFHGFISIDSVTKLQSSREVVLFSIDFKVSQNFLDLLLQDANFGLK